MITVEGYPVVAIVLVVVVVVVVTVLLRITDNASAFTISVYIGMSD